MERLEPDRAAELLNHRFAKGESEACPIGVSALLAHTSEVVLIVEPGDASEKREQSRFDFLTDTDSCVCH